MCLNVFVRIFEQRKRSRQRYTEYSSSSKVNGNDPMAYQYHLTKHKTRSIEIIRKLPVILIADENRILNDELDEKG